MTPARKIIMAANKEAGDKKPKVEDTAHEPAKHIVETARLASSVENAKIPARSAAPRTRTAGNGRCSAFASSPRRTQPTAVDLSRNLQVSRAHGQMESPVSPHGRSGPGAPGL